MNISKKIEGMKKVYQEDVNLTPIGKDIALSVINKFEAFLEEYDLQHNAWRSPENPPETDDDVLILYVEKGEKCTKSKLASGHAVVKYGRRYFGGNPFDFGWSQPFPFFDENFEIIGWKPINDDSNILPKEHGALLVCSDGYTIDYERFTSAEDARAEMESRYRLKYPYKDDETKDEITEMSELGFDSAILYDRGRNVYVWQVIDLSKE